MKERPILFSGEMVRAILEGRKTQTRRVVKQVAGVAEFLDERITKIVSAQEWLSAHAERAESLIGFCPYGAPGDRLWVRETWMMDDGAPDTLMYRADGEYNFDMGDKPGERAGWRPSIFMPRWASRLTLEIVDVRVERLQEINNEEAVMEGMDRKPGELHPSFADLTPRDLFESLWDELNAKRGFPWAGNPWVWVVEFKKL